MRNSDRDSLSDGIRLAESAIALQKRTPLSILALYYIGALPFATGFLMAWNMLTHQPGAETEQAMAALGLALLFAWMKVWQNRYAQALYHHAIQAPEPRIGIDAYLRLAGRQTLVQALGLVAVPLSLLALLPFPWVHGVFHSFTVLDDGGNRPLNSYWSEAIAHSQANPRQQITLLWLLSPILIFSMAVLFLFIGPFLWVVDPLLGESIFFVYFLVFAIVLLPLSPFPVGVFINVAAGVYFVAGLARSLFGIRTPFSEIPNFFGSSYSILLTLILCWLLLDPLMKTAYVIRHIESHSRKSGVDIQLAFKKLGGSAILVLVIASMLLLAPVSSAQAPPQIDDAMLEQAINDELSLERYRWRMPEASATEEEPTWLQEMLQGLLERLRNTLDAIFEWLGKLLDWLFPPREPRPAAEGLGIAAFVRDSLRGILVMLAVALSALALYLYLRYRKSQKPHDNDMTASAPVPDIESEDTSADALPAEGWIGMAEHFLSHGNHRLAARAVYLAILARLAEQRRISIARHKTNRDYHRELERFSHVAPGLAASFQVLTRGYEAVWYGDRAAERGLVEAMLAEHRGLQHLET